jgi:uncharacterized protein (TIGR02611 family)
LAARAGAAPAGEGQTMSAHARRTAGPADRIKAHWDDFKCGKPGKRFEERFRRRQRQGHNPLAKIVTIVAGLVLLMAGLVMIPAPGPGFLVVFPGAALIAEESYFAARLFDRIELKGRQTARNGTRAWKHAPPVLKAAVVALALVLAVAAGLGLYVAYFA